MYVQYAEFADFIRQPIPPASPNGTYSLGSASAIPVFAERYELADSGVAAARNGVEAAGGRPGGKNGLL